MVNEYVPERGHFIWIDLNPQSGHEQAGRRPAIVVSPAGYNLRTGLCLICPVTNRVKGYPFEVAIPQGQKVSGVVLSDQIKFLDWRARRADFICPSDRAVMEEVIAKLKTLTE